MRLDELLAKLFAGKDGLEEKQQLSLWKQDYVDNIDGLDKLKQVWEESNELNGYQDFDKTKAWNNIQESIEKQPVGIFNLPPNFAIAATIILLICSVFIFQNHFAESDITKHYASSSEMYELPDGSSIYLFADASVEHAVDFSTARQVKLQGNAFFQVKPNVDLPFTVQTNQLDIEVLGTSFLVEQNQAFTDVGVIEGKVKLVAQNLETILSVNDYVRVHANSKDIEQRDLKNPLFGKIPGLIIAENEAVISLLHRVLAETEYKLLVESLTPECKVKANFINQPTDDIIEEISLICDFSYHKTDQAYVIE